MMDTKHPLLEDPPIPTIEEEQVTGDCQGLIEFAINYPARSCLITLNHN